MKKTILTILGTIFLGAIGSGLWDLVLSDAISWISNIVLTSISSLFSGYLDILYGDISEGPLFPLIIEPYKFLFIFLIMLPIFGVLRIHRKIQRLKNKIDTKTNSESSLDNEHEITEIESIFKFKLLPLIGVLAVMVVLQLWQGLYTHAASSFIERSIDVVATVITDAERKELIAKYRMISNADDFYLLEKRLNTIANNNSLKLPKFSSL